MKKFKKAESPSDSQWFWNKVGWAVIIAGTYGVLGFGWRPLLAVLSIPGAMLFYNTCRWLAGSEEATPVKG